VKSDEIRTSFLQFFQERGHEIERSDKVVPANDPTLLFTSAGMVQFKPYYTGEAPVPYRRATTSQKCLRAGGKANDLDEVGKTSRHLTFFEMLGNFSFGDYFKREAIEWAWEFSTEVLGIDGDAIWVSVYTDDDEAYGIWEKEVGVPTSRIVRLGAKDNFWGPAGDTGACGPCSELLFDRGEEIDPNATLEEDPKERFLEFWNLVFPQFDQQTDGSRPPLVNRGIDTGMGLERLAAMLQNKPTVFDTDGVFPIIEATQSLSRTPYSETPVPYRVIADHARAVSFMIADGILPSNEGRGYVERRLLRRAARFGREIGLEKPFLHEIVETVVRLMGSQYPELVERQRHITKVIHTEEERFESTLKRGMDLLEDVFTTMTSDGETTVPGDELFRLHDTYGFPLDLATDIAEDRGYSVDRAGFEASMTNQKSMARNAWSGTGEETIAPVYRHVLDNAGETKFVGYEELEAKASIKAVIKSGQEVDSLENGEEGEIVLSTTPCYAESGGQVGDTGLLDGTNGSAHVAGTYRPIDGIWVHKVIVTSGALRPGDDVLARVDGQKRRATENHHTATHLLQAALQDVMGDHVHQAGSQVAPERLRFDFTHFEGIDSQRLQDIERKVNGYIRLNTPIEITSMSIDDARAAGAMALFGEKYGDVVRVVKAGDVSMELCGGCHVPATGVIGYFKIISESSIAAGVRRIEALCGDACLDYVQEREQAMNNAAHLLNVSPDQLADRVTAMVEENKRLSREVTKWKQAAATGGAVDYMANVHDVGGLPVIAAEVDGQDAAGLRIVMDSLRDKLPSGVVVLGSASDGKAALCVSVTKDLTKQVKAGDIVKQLAPMVGGGGGGRPDMAMAGGKSPEKVPEAIAQACAVIKGLLN
jgi:alanyl-tRNA synthetase